MEFDWIDSHFDLKAVTPKEVEETFEDPFALKILPEGKWVEAEARYICVGKTVNNRTLLSIFWTDGKKFRVILSREATEAETNFYDRKHAEFL